MQGEEEFQRKLNRMVVAFNKVLLNCNEPDAAIPLISKKVHACKGHKTWSHKYQFLADGCQFNLDRK